MNHKTNFELNTIPAILSWAKAFRCEQLTTWVNVYAESEIQIEHVQILHPNPENRENEPKSTLFNYVLTEFSFIFLLLAQKSGF